MRATAHSQAMTHLLAAVFHIRLAAEDDMSYLRAISVSSFLLLASTLVNSQQLAEVFDNPSEHIIRRVDEVVLMISATDRRGRFISNMRREDFQILDNHHPPSKWNYFQSRTDLPLRVMLVVDTSTSVGERLRLEQKAACAFLKRVLRPNIDEVGLIAFESDVHEIEPLTRNVDSIGTAIKRLHVGDETKLYDALVTGSQELNQVAEVQPMRRVILLVTDGLTPRARLHWKKLSRRF
jgi:VWFA-related protein